MSAQEENGEETEYQQVDYDESGLQHQHEEINEFQLAEQQRTSNQTAKDGNNQKQRTLPPDENGDIIVPNVLFVSRFRFGSTTEPEIKRHFEKYGSIKSVSLRHKVAYVEYENDDDAKQAKQDAHYKPGLGSNSLIVDFKKENKVKPRPDDYFSKSSRDYDSKHRGNSAPSSSSGYSNDRPSHSNGNRGGPSYPPADRDRRYDRYPDSGHSSRNDYYDDRGRPPVDYRSYPPGPDPYRKDREPRPVDYPPKYEAPPASYNRPPAYNPPPDYGRPPSGYDDRRGAPGPSYPPAHKRPYEAVSDYYPPAMRGPPPARDYPPSRPYDMPPSRPYSEAPPSSRGIEPSTYAAGANRPRDAPRPSGYGGPPARYDSAEPRDFPPPREADYHGHGPGPQRSDFRPPMDNYQSKRTRY